VVKSVRGHSRAENERDVLKRFYYRTPFLRLPLGEIEEPSTPTTIALRYLESDLLSEKIQGIVNQMDLKHICQCVLEALRIYKKKISHMQV
jgi:hypothetical protein